MTQHARETLAALAERTSTAMLVLDRRTTHVVAANAAAVALGVTEGAPAPEWLAARIDEAGAAEVRAGGERSFDVESVPMPGGRVGVTLRELPREGRAVLDELRDVYDRTPVGHHSLDHAGVYRRVNQTQLAWLGYSAGELVGTTRFADLLTPASRESFELAHAQLEQGGEIAGLELDMRRRDGLLLPVMLHAAAVRDAGGRLLQTRCTLIDLTERSLAAERAREMWAEIEHHIALGTEELRRANEGLRAEIAAREKAQAALAQTEAQLRQAQKMEAIGRLAGGVAHDFNNMLSVILIFTELALGELGPDEPRRADLEQVRDAASRATDLTRQLLAFSRQQVVDARPIVVDEVVSSLERLLQRLLGEDVELETRLDARHARILADVGQIEQVIVNLAVNARDAMPRGGRLAIETRVADVDEALAAAQHGLRPGRYVRVSVSDTGIGMDQATLERAFEPFFTTKEPGKGTGLGLSTVYGIVAQSGGQVWARSEVGEGTTFELCLPIVEADARLGDARSLLAGASGGSETILLVEDDPLVRGAARRILTRGGYAVIEASSPTEAMVLASGPGRIHALLTDVVMPILTGPELADRLRADQRDLPVVFMSGYLDVEVLGERVLDEGARFVQKPLTSEALLRALRDAIDDR